MVNSKQKKRGKKAEIWSHLDRDDIFMVSLCTPCWTYLVKSLECSNKNRYLPIVRPID